MTISWRSKTKETPSVTQAESAPALAEPSSRQTAHGIQKSYIKGSYDNHVTLTGLKLSTQQWYAIGSYTGNFVTAPEVDSSKPFSVAVYGDMGLANTSDSFGLMDIFSNDVSFFWHIGDIGQADDCFLHITSFAKDCQEEAQNEQMQQLTVASFKPYMVLPGNHEAECHSPYCQISHTTAKALGDFRAYLSRFQMPQQVSGAPTNMWYSFNQSFVHFISISTESDQPGVPDDAHVVDGPTISKFGDQLKWLEKDLQQAVANRKQRPWIIVAGHRPLQAINNSKFDKVNDDVQNRINLFEALFHKQDVDMQVCGHVHNQQRMQPIYQNKKEESSTITKAHQQQPKHTTYVLSGAAGSIEGHLNQTEREEWTAEQNGTDWGLGKLTFLSGTKLQWDFIKSDDHTVADTFILERARD